MTQDREWTSRQRLQWRVAFAATVLTAGAIVVSLFGYLWTRASDADLALKADRAEISRLDARIDTLGALVGNIRDNLLVLMVKMKADPISPPVQPIVAPVQGQK